MFNNEIFDISDPASHDKYIEFLNNLGVQFMTREMALEIGRKRHRTKDGRPRKRNYLSRFDYNYKEENNMNTINKLINPNMNDLNSRFRELQEAHDKAIGFVRYANTEDILKTEIAQLEEKLAKLTEQSEQ